MYSRTGTSGSTEACFDIRILSDWLSEADRVVVGAGSGLSASAGMLYSGPRFDDNFSDFRDAYGFTDMYTGGFTHFRSPEEKWGYWSRMIMLNRYLREDNGTYGALRKILSGKDYFILTTNVDHCFQSFGFDKLRLFYTQGDYGLWQCSRPCCNRTYDNESQVRRMYAEQDGMRIPSDLIPRCPMCGRPMEMNLRCDGRFVQDDGWYAAADRYRDFIMDSSHSDVLFLELGVGFSTPGIIKYPFWSMTAANDRSKYACVNLGPALLPDEISRRAIGIDGDIGSVLAHLAGDA